MSTKSKFKNGFTLAEILISIGLFATIAIVAGSIFTDLSNLEKKSSIRDSFFTSISIILQQITNEIQNGTVDYEEYFNMEVIGSATNGKIPTGGPYYGINYGAYGSRFYSPGQSLDGLTALNPDDLGMECSYPNDIENSNDCEILFGNSLDLKKGQNPWSAADDTTQKYANAFCDTNDTACNTIVKADELYLMDKTGTKKTIIGKKKFKITGTEPDYSIGILRMSGRDLDQNGLMDVFSCTEDFTCTTPLNDTIQYPIVQNSNDIQQFLTDASVTLPKKADLEKVFIANASNFIPISPSNITIKDLKFMINPVEDPFKATAETSAQMHPSVTIFIKFGLSVEAAEAYPGNFPDVEVQTTVSAGTSSLIESYPSVNDVLNPTAGGESWIKNVLPGGVN